MKTRLTRREALQVAMFGGLGGLAAACATPPDAPAAQPTRIEASPPPLPTSASVQPTSTAAPAVEAAPATEAAIAAPPEPTAAPLTASIALAATGFLAALDDGQRAKATYDFADAERIRWHWTTPRGFPRNGLPLREMGADQRDLALTLLHTSLSDYGFQKALDIISLQNDLGNDPELYFVTVFGQPGGAEPWGWRFEGHHLSRNFTLVGDQLTVTPFFLGSWPTVSSAGLKAMEREEWAARELIASLEGEQRQAVTIQNRALGQHVTQNMPYVAPLDPVGLEVGELSADRQALVLEIIQDYLGTLPGDLAAAHFERLEAAGYGAVRFGWAGEVTALKPHYYRLQGATFLLEFDNSRNGATHIHSVWRDFTQDFGQSLM